MKIGCPKEIKSQEFRVGIIPAAVKVYVDAGHEVFVQEGAGIGSGIPDEQYQQAGAHICPAADEVWDASDMIIKVKEPLASEYDFMRPGQLLYTFFHFAADEKLTRACLEKKDSRACL